MNALAAHPTLIHLGSFRVTMHGLLFAIGALVGMWMLARQRARFGQTSLWVVESVFWIFLLSLLGARIAYLLAYPGTWENPIEFLKIWDGGLVSFGGLLVGVGVALYRARALKPAEKVAFLDAAGVALLFAWAIGRIGNYYAAESVGVVSAAWSAFYGRVPIQLFETIGCVGAALVLPRLKLRPGLTGVASVAAYLALRFIVDFWRDEDMALGLHISQYFSLIGLVIIAIWYWRRGRHA